MTERNGQGEAGDRYDATDATERRSDEGTVREDAMAGAIGAGSPEDVGQSTFAATTDTLQHTIGEDRAESGSYESLRVGDRVHYEVGTDDRRGTPKAVHVQAA